jgi:hypothetical protein
MVLRFTMNHAQDGNRAARVLVIIVLRQETPRDFDGHSDRRIRRVHGRPSSTVSIFHEIEQI